MQASSDTNKLGSNVRWSRRSLDHGSKHAMRWWAMRCNPLQETLNLNLTF